MAAVAIETRGDISRLGGQREQHRVLVPPTHKRTNAWQYGFKKAMGQGMRRSYVTEATRTTYWHTCGAIDLSSRNLSATITLNDPCVLPRLFHRGRLQGSPILQQFASNVSMHRYSYLKSESASVLRRMTLCLLFRKGGSSECLWTWSRVVLIRRATYRTDTLEL